MSASLSGRQWSDTRAGVEMTVVWAFVGIRGLDLIQCAVSLTTGSLTQSTNRVLDLTIVALVFVESALLFRWLIKRRSVLPARWPLALDFALALVSLGTSAVFVPADARSGQWTMWAFAMALSTAVLIGGTLARWQYVIAGSGALLAAYLAVVAVPFSNASQLATAVTNSIAYPGFAMVAYYFTRFVRALADTADEAKAQVLELERERSKARVHNLLPYLRWDKFVEADQQTQLEMIEQAGMAFREMRSYVDGTQDPRDVEGCVRSVLDLHRRLDVRTVFELDHGLRLPEDVIDRMRQALDTALANVEQHASGAAVVVSASSDLDQVEVIVHDDGPGFDRAAVRAGYGIGEILGRQLEAVGGRGVVESVPGGGTEVRITVPRQPS